MTAWDIYWLTRLEPPLGSIFVALASLAALAAFALLVIALCLLSTCEDDSVEQGKNISRHAIKVGLLAFLPATAAALIPDRGDLAIIFAGSWATNSAEMQKLPENVLKTMNKFMSDYVGEKDEPKP